MLWARIGLHVNSQSPCIACCVWLLGLLRYSALCCTNNTLGCWDPAPWDVGVADSQETHSSPISVTIPQIWSFYIRQTVCAYFWRSSGNVWPFASSFSRSFKVIGTDTDRSATATYDFLLVFHSNYAMEHSIVQCLSTQPSTLHETVNEYQLSS